MLIARKKDVQDGKEIEPTKKIPNLTLKQLADEYLKWAERQRGYRTKKNMVLQLIEIFGNNYLRQFNTRMLEQFQSERLLKGMRQIKVSETEWITPPNKPATINRLMATLKHMMHKAYEWEFITEDNWKRVRQVKLLEENNRRLRFLTKEECAELINQCKGVTRAIVITALNSGMRKSEILSLKWENVDLKHGFILLDKTKNGERREIPINESLKAVFQGITRRLDVPYVFYDPETGKPYGNIKRSFATACRRAGIHDFRFHDIRHTFASHLVMAGIDITTVRELLGHSTLTMTLRYAHLAPSHKVNAVDILDAALTGKTNCTKSAQIAGMKC